MEAIIRSFDKTRREKDRDVEERIGGRKLNCPNGIEFLSGIFIANVLRVRRHFYETHAASRNHVAHNRARRKIFPKAPGQVGEMRRIEIRRSEKFDESRISFAKISYLENIY